MQEDTKTTTYQRNNQFIKKRFMEQNTQRTDQRNDFKENTSNSYKYNFVNKTHKKLIKEKNSSKKTSNSSKNN